MEKIQNFSQFYGLKMAEKIRNAENYQTKWWKNQNIPIVSKIW